MNDAAGFRAIRHNQKWRDLTGDGMVLQLTLEVARLRDIIGRGDTEADSKEYPNEEWLQTLGLDHKYGVGWRHDGMPAGVGIAEDHDRIVLRHKLGPDKYVRILTLPDRGSVRSYVWLSKRD